MAKRKTNPDFDVALSFAGEDRNYVEEVASSSSCKDCSDIAIATLDFSVLSTLAALDEVH